MYIQASPLRRRSVRPPVPSEYKEKEGFSDDKVAWLILKGKLPIYYDSLWILDLEGTVNSDMLLLLEVLRDVLLKPFTVGG